MTLNDMQTPAFVLSEAALKKNLARIQTLKQLSGAKVVLALKCFSAWGVFPILSAGLDGTTSSSPYEVQLGHETFGGETQAYSVAYNEDDVRAVDARADKIIFNSLSQLARFAPLVKTCPQIGLRINPEVSHASHILADPARPFSRLGVVRAELDTQQADLSRVSGLMFHMQCENDDAADFARILAHISENFADLLARVDWVSLGGGVLFTRDGFDLPQFAQTLQAFAQKHAVQVYLEPGEAVVTQAGELVTTVLDIIQNQRQVAILDASSEAHRLDTLLYHEPARAADQDANGAYDYLLAGNSCLAGDIFGEARFAKPLMIGDRVRLLDSAGYTLVKQNWFNGLRMPDVYCLRESGELVLLNRHDYQDFKLASSRHSV